MSNFLGKIVVNGECYTKVREIDDEQELMTMISEDAPLFLENSVWYLIEKSI